MSKYKDGNRENTDEKDILFAILIELEEIKNKINKEKEYGKLVAYDE